MIRSRLPFAVSALSFALLAMALPSDAATIDVTVGPGTAFSPRDITIQPGDTVRWTNAGGSHNVRASNGSFRCANGCDGQGGNGTPAANAWVVTLTFNDPGLIAYFCELHGNAAGAGMAGTITVQGQQNPGNVRFSATGYTVGEGDGARLVTVQRMGGSDGAASVQYATSNGSATAGQDYTATSGTLNWADGDAASKTFNVPILNDSQDESNESFSVNLSNVTGAALGSPSSTTITIVDNDDPPELERGQLQFSVGTVTVSETASEAVLIVNRVNGDDGAVAVSYATGGGTAEAGEDYVATSGTLSWNNNDDDAKTFSVPLIDDTLIEGDETFFVELSNPTNGAGLGNPSSAAVEILENDVNQPSVCTPGETILCLAEERFRVTVEFRTPQGVEDVGQAVQLTPDTGYFWFFNEANVEMVIKVLDACSFANRFWVFAGGLTNVEVDIMVEDTETGAVQMYQNPIRTPFQPIQDTDAFATCP